MSLVVNVGAGVFKDFTVIYRHSLSFSFPTITSWHCPFEDVRENKFCFIVNLLVKLDIRLKESQRNQYFSVDSITVSPFLNSRPPPCFAIMVAWQHSGFVVSNYISEFQSYRRAQLFISNRPSVGLV